MFYLLCHCAPPNVKVCWRWETYSFAFRKQPNDARHPDTGLCRQHQGVIRLTLKQTQHQGVIRLTLKQTQHQIVMSDTETNTTSDRHV